MLSVLINQIYILYYSQSKYNLISVNNKFNILQVTFKTVIYLKKKNKFFLFLKILHLLLFQQKAKTFFLLKNSNINFITTVLTSKKDILIFLHNYLYIYLPLIDSFLVDWKILYNRDVVSFCFFKFPIFFELSVIFLSVEHLLPLINSYKYQIDIFLIAQKNKKKNIVFLQQLKLPLLS